MNVETFEPENDIDYAFGIRVDKEGREVRSIGEVLNEVQQKANQEKGPAMAKKKEEGVEEVVGELVEDQQPEAVAPVVSMQRMTPVSGFTNFDAAIAKSEVLARQKITKEIVEQVMIQDVHYGVIPGTGKKPTMLKAGAETILQTFSVAAVPKIEELSQGDYIRYRVTCEGRHIGSGLVVGAGIGECSSMEEKYRWRKAYGNEYDEAPATERRVKKYKNFSAKQVLQNPFEVANTILKQAKKRALVDLALTVGACSDMFTQDIEEMRQYVSDQQENLEEAQGKSGGRVPEAEKAKISRPRKKEKAREEGEPAGERPAFEGYPEKPEVDGTTVYPEGFNHKKVYTIETCPANAPRITREAAKALFGAAKSAGVENYKERVTGDIESLIGFTKLSEIPVGATYERLLAYFKNGAKKVEKKPK